MNLPFFGLETQNVEGSDRTPWQGVAWILDQDEVCALGRHE